MTASRQASDGPDTGRQAVPEPNPRLEPLLWLQLLGIGAIVGESLGLLVVLGSVDPGPVPGLERLLIWALGALAPAVLLWKRPADPWSLLLLQAPIRGRRDLQRRLLRLQDQPLLRVSPLLAAALLLPTLWRIDQAGGLATGLSPLADSNRLVVLLLSVPLLALIVWQWQQVGQALWLLSRPVSAIQAAEPLSMAEQEQQRLSLGLPVLLLDPLQGPTPPARPAEAPEAERPQTPVAAAATGASAEPGAQAEDSPTDAAAAKGSEPLTPEQRPDSDTTSPGAPASEAEPGAEIEASGSGSIEPEQTAGDGQGGDLDQEVTGLEP